MNLGVQGAKFSDECLVAQQGISGPPDISRADGGLKRRAATRKPEKGRRGLGRISSWLCSIAWGLTLGACAYPSNLVNDVAHMGDPTYDECRRNADALSNYGSRCANEADPKVKASKAEQARQAAERQRLMAAAVQQRADAQQSADAALGYSRIAVRDFILDGRELASRSAKVSLVGVYLPAGNLHLLFSNNVDAVQFANGPVQNIQLVHLLTTNASHSFRSQVLACRSNPSAEYVGCAVRILGIATMCALTGPLGARQEVPCVSVEEGGF